VHTELKIKLIPRSSRNEILGREGDGYKVKVTSPPVEGMANKALIVLLAEKLGVPKRDIEITAGNTSRMKTVRIYGMTQEDIVRALKVKQRTFSVQEK
jgi:uncharacterized protein (TIGR00251 family)